MSNIEINISGRKVGLKFGLPAVRHFFERSATLPLINVNNDNGQQTYSDLGIAHILYGGYRNNQLAKDLPEQLLFEDFYNLVENEVLENGVLAEEITNAVRAFESSKSMEYGSRKIQEMVEEQKKRMIIPSNGIESQTSASGNSG